MRPQCQSNKGFSPFCRSEEKLKIVIFCRNSKLQNRPDFGNTLPFESDCEFALNSTNLSPITNSESQRYQYPVCHTLVTTQHPLSRFQSSARGPGLSLTRSLNGLHVVARALLVENEDRNRVYSALR